MTSVALADDERHVVRSRPGRRDDPQRHVPEVDDVAIGELPGLVRQVPPAARTDEHGHPELLGHGLGAGGMVGIGVGQRDRDDPPATSRGHLDRPIQASPVGSPGSTSTNAARPTR